MKAFYHCLTIVFTCATILVSSLLLSYTARAADDTADQPGSTIVHWQASAESAQEFLAAAKELNLSIEEGDADSLAKLVDPALVEAITADKITADELTDLMIQRRRSASKVGSNLAFSLFDKQMGVRALVNLAKTVENGHSAERIIIIIKTDCCIWIIIF